jgi:hypothetical protein
MEDVGSIKPNMGYDLHGAYISEKGNPMLITERNCLPHMKSLLSPTSAMTLQILCTSSKYASEYNPSAFIPAPLYYLFVLACE